MVLDVKICGLKTPEAVTAALDGGATHIGFIFFPKSPRHLAPAQAARLREAARGRAKVVAVTVDTDDVALDEIVAQLNPDMLQLHGHETPERVRDVKARYGLPVMKAFAVREALDLAAITPYRGIADRFLFDARPPKGAELPGGNGIAFDWALLDALDADVDYMLSGGLNAGNIAEALLKTKAPGIDVSSGVERAPGEKDVRLIEEFFQAIARADEKSSSRPCLNMTERKR
ncbi:phosphoribosylanthranilate isomerase [Falsochrobactrum sp. TDYN1]|uniref:N-(5'-phosphoribosyl)anthranilate isomerase n=1 Tax=Falsochrobactrum tianjinense TaxID=2706015 RepID=A0A949PJX4_9HYPH|nr:phosphoribosylanthranilate isomerase [Falsochrobactrum sp. TDYN1]MBV2142073.1 phosphoribosylanthranilate isomerase [Falsochrobactrum sp. TDYN1]